MSALSTLHLATLLTIATKQVRSEEPIQIIHRLLRSGQFDLYSSAEVGGLGGVPWDGSPAASYWAMMTI